MIAFRVRKYFEESLLLLAYRIVRRAATHVDPRLAPLLREFDRMREEL